MGSGLAAAMGLTPERWKQIEELYNASLHQAPEIQDVLLASAPTEIRNVVRDLLLHQVTGILDKPAWAGETECTSSCAAISPGMSLGPYEIKAVLGAGGMGQVFRGRDTRLNRPVAIKVLNAQFSDRFEREARAISSLNHPHICTLYDVGPDFLVMELLEGETLAERLKKGPLGMNAVIQYGQQIGSALAAAHAKGIVHRDLKPGNIMVTKSGVKILDFGLAKAAQDETLTLANGVIGTPAYMSPEQREGKVCDARTDIYSFGLILREMLSGKRGGDPSPAETPQFIQLVDRCLCEEPDDRWQSASDLAYLLGSSGTQLQSPAPLNSVEHPWRTWLGAAALVLVLAVVVWNRITPRGVAPAVMRLALTLPTNGLASALDPGQPGGPPVISPDGKTVVVSLVLKGQSVLWMRHLESARFERINGTEGVGGQPFWSPDGTRIAFFADGKLKKIKLPNGAAETLCDVPATASRGGAWSSKGIILFGINFKGLMKISENGGEPVPVTVLDDHLKENSHRFPQFLPDGNQFIYFSRTLDPRNHAVYLDALDTVGKVPRKKLVTAEGASVVGHDPYSGRDLLVFPNDGHLWAQRFNINAGLLHGEKTAISDDVGQFSLSGTGTLVFRRASSQQMTLTWLDRTGRVAGQAGQPGEYLDVSLSPNEKFAAVLSHRSREGRFWVEMIDLAKNLQNPFSDPAARATGMVWSNDSASLYFTRWGEKGSQIVLRRVDSASAAQPYFSSPEINQVTSLTPDGETFAAEHWIGANQRGGIAFLHDGKPPWKVFGSPLARVSHGQFSPDGKWLLYQQEEGSIPEIYVSDFPGLKIRRRISVSGGVEPRWRRDGKEVFYLATDGSLMSALVEDEVHLTFAKPSALFHFWEHLNLIGLFSYDVARDGGRILAIGNTTPTNARDLTVVINWPQLMSAEAPH